MGMDNIKRTLKETLEEFNQRERLNAADIDVICMLTKTLKNIYKIEMYEEYGGEEERYSERRDARGRYASRGSYDGGEYSGRRGGYSRHDPKERVMDMLEDMKKDAQGKDKEAIHRMIELARDM